MENYVWDFIVEHDLIQEEQNIGVAVSGGADSMALLVCLCKLSQLHNFSVSAVHFEHGIRGQESIDDAMFVSEFCKSRGILFYMTKADVPKLARDWKMSKQLAAKQARENYFESLVCNGTVDAIATAHHSDDLAESIFMHILRGSGLDGLVGIHERNGVFLRPFLHIGKEEILNYLKENDVQYVTDSSNDETIYKRNYIRNVLLPMIEQNINTDVKQALRRLGTLAKQDAAYIDRQAIIAFNTCATQKDSLIELDIAQWKNYDEAIRSRVLREALKKVGLFKDVEFIHLELLSQLAQIGETGKQLDLPNNICAAVQYGALIIGSKDNTDSKQFQVRLNLSGSTNLPSGAKLLCSVVQLCERDAKKDKYTEFLDADMLSRELWVRTRKNGDRIFPLGAPGTKKLKDYLIDIKLPRQQRDCLPLLADGKQIIWVVGHIIGNDYRIKEGTSRILKVQYIPANEEEQ